MRVQSRHLHTSLTRPRPSSPQPGVLGVVEHSRKGRRLQYSRYYYPYLRIISNITSSRVEVVAGVIKNCMGAVRKFWMAGQGIDASTAIEISVLLARVREIETNKGGRIYAAEALVYGREGCDT
jgi:hypothetical protein